MSEGALFNGAGAANDHYIQPGPKNTRERTVPIPETITPVPGYPQKLVVYRIAASSFWQVRCWNAGRTHKRSTRTQSLKAALNVARLFYERLLVEQHLQNQETLDGPDTQPATAAAPGALPAFSQPGRAPAAHRAARPKQTPLWAAPTFRDMADKVLRNEHARALRGELSRGSVQVMKNRLDSNILPRWGDTPIDEIDHEALLDFVNDLSEHFSSITVSQHMVLVRKVLSHAADTQQLARLPVFPKLKVTSTSRGAFTPTEYWRIMRCARRLRRQSPPQPARTLRESFRLRNADQDMPADLAWAIGFMVNSFIRPSDLKSLRHRYIEIVRSSHTYLRLTLPASKKHDKPIVTLQPAVRIYEQLLRHQRALGYGGPDDFLFLPQLHDRSYAHWVLNFHFNWVLQETSLKQGPHGQPRSLYSLRHSAITFRLLYGQGIDMLTLARNARTSVDMINRHYASTVTAEQNIGLLQSRRRTERPGSG